jgi:hypothetical protein
MGRKVMVKTGSVLFQNTIQILRCRTKKNQETIHNYEIVSECFLNAIQTGNNYYDLLEELKFRIIMKIFRGRIGNEMALRGFGFFTFGSN